MVYMIVPANGCFHKDFHLFDCGGHQPCTLLENGIERKAFVRKNGLTVQIRNNGSFIASFISTQKDFKLSGLRFPKNGNGVMKNVNQQIMDAAYIFIYYAIFIQ
ncbi:hypothetical protein MTBBW1_10050 [Desulfamplus magnetovallimortis]|uniref:Uncharacterized protein n=1 Tax=Desulfamplus magnetovallimortis TaxID=1246637 RepID=A0A1W1H4J1_9BACT|nr:hypothetical protein MTBBW1_10050 [Desulfamplus magnetovallimortis]